MSQRKKVLLITYYWPPAGGAGVQRWLKMSKILASHCDLTIYHPTNADFPMLDDSLRKEIPEQATYITQPIREPYALARKLNSKNKNYQKGHIEEREKQSILSKLSLWIRANVFIPDARMLWIRPSYHYLSSYLAQHPQDVIITTGPPHSMHLIGLKLKQKFPKIKWIADFRDPWTNIDYFDKLPLQKFAYKKHAHLERLVLEKANIITTVSPSWAKDLEALGNKKVQVIYNGFDQEDFQNEINPDKAFVLTYIGSLNPDRNPKILWQALEKLCENPVFLNSFELRLVGSISPTVKQNIQELTLLKCKTNFIGYLDHNKAIEVMQSSQILLLLINATSNENGIIPGKFFEYLAAKRRILCIGKQDSDMADLLDKLDVGTVIERNDEQTMMNTLDKWFQEYQQGNLNNKQRVDISDYARSKAAFKFLELMETD